MDTLHGENKHFTKGTDTLQGETDTMQGVGDIQTKVGESTLYKGGTDTVMMPQFLRMYASLFFSELNNNNWQKWA